MFKSHVMGIIIGWIAAVGQIAFANERYKAAHNHFSSKSYSDLLLWVGGVAALVVIWMLYRKIKKKR